jgi:hypothetical protein
MRAAAAAGLPCDMPPAAAAAWLLLCVAAAAAEGGAASRAGDGCPGGSVLGEREAGVVR